MADIIIRRGFVDLPHGQMHYRMAGASGAPLLILHASPGSSRQQLRMMAGFAGEARVYAPDTPGNGDSAPLGRGERTIADLAAAIIGFMDAMGLDKVHLFGTHTGAAIAVELAIAAPERVSRLVLEGIGVFTPEEQRDMLAHYAPSFTPDLDGAYLLRVFQFCRDQYLYFPWYRRSREARRDGGLGSAEDLHGWVVEVLKACETYQHNYHASFKWDAAGSLPRVTCPTLVMAAANDPLLAPSAAGAPLMRGGRFLALPRGDAPDFIQVRHAAMARFLADEPTRTKP